MKRFNIKSFIALILAVAMLLTGIPYGDVKANAAYTADQVGSEISLPDNKVGTLIGATEIIPENFKLEDNDTDLVKVDPQPDEGVKFVVDSTNGHGGKIRNRIQNFNGGEGVAITDGTLFFLEYEASEGFDITKLDLEGANSANGWTVKYYFTRTSNENGFAVYSVPASSEPEDKLYDIRLKASAGKIADGESLTIKNAFFVSDIKDAPVSTGIKVGEKLTVGNQAGTVVAFTEAKTENILLEGSATDLIVAEDQPDDGVKLVLDTENGLVKSGKIRTRIQNFNGTEGFVVGNNVLFFLEYEASEDFDISKLSLKGMTEKGGWTEGFSLSLKSNKNGLAVYSVPASDSEEKKLCDIRIKADSGIPNGATITIKNAVFMTDVEEVTEPSEPTEPAEGLKVGEIGRIGDIQGKVVAFSEANTENYYVESADFNQADTQENGSVKFVLGGDGKIRNRIKNFTGGPATITEDTKLVLEYEADGGFSFDKLTVEGTKAEGGWDADFTLDLVSDKNGVAIFSITPTGESTTLYDVRLKANAGIVDIGATLTLKNAVIMTGVETAVIPADELKVGDTRKAGSLTGKIVAISKNNEANYKRESGGFDAKIVDGKVKFVYAGSGSVRNRIYFRDGGVQIADKMRFVIEYESEGNFDFSELTLEGTKATDGWDADFSLSLDKDENGIAVFTVKANGADNTTLYDIRLKGSDGIFAEGASLLIKTAYFLGDVVDESVPLIPVGSYEASNKVMGITVTYYNDTLSRGVSWRTQNLKAEDSCLQVVNKKDVDDISKFMWDTDDVETIPDNFGQSWVNHTADKSTYYCHKAHIENLDDNSEYWYRVGCEESGWSRPGTFKVNSSKDDFTFIHVTDPQATKESEYRQYENVLRAAYKNVRSTGSEHAGTFNTGDITNECHDGGVYIDEYNMSQDYDSDDLMDSVYIPVAGNHDVTEDLFWSMYEIDFANYCSDGKHNSHRTGGCYSYQVGNVFILGSNSNESGDLANNPANGEYDSKANYHEQYNWIVGQLKKAEQLREEGKIKWIIYLTHAGMMSVGYHTMDGGSKCLRENITPLLAKYKVDLVLQGHDHAYTRTVPYYYGKDLNGDTFSGFVSNERETFKGYGEVSYDNPYTAEVETEGDRKWNVEPEGTHYITINYAGTKSLDISKDNAEARYQMPPQYILDGLATSPINGYECGLKYSKQFYALIRITDDVLTYDTYSFSGGKSELFDTFTVIKDSEHEPNLDKQEVEFTGVYVEDKEFDGKAARLETDDILAVKPGTEEKEELFTDYTKVVFKVTGTLADGSQYQNTEKLPREIGVYTLHVMVSDESPFFKGESTVTFRITDENGAVIINGKDYVGGLTKDKLADGGTIAFTDGGALGEGQAPKPAPGGDTPSPQPGGDTTEPGTELPYIPPYEEPSQGVEPGEEIVDIGGGETPEGAVDASDEILGKYFKKDKQFTGKKLTGFDAVLQSAGGTYPREIKVRVNTRSIGKEGRKLYLYKVDRTGKKLLETTESKLIVGADGCVKFTAYAEGEFVLLKSKADKKTVVSLADQITVKKKINVKAGKKTKKNAMGLVLPPELSESEVAFTSGNKKIAKINKKSGKVTAVKKGTAKLRVKVTLPDGTVKVLVTKITVK